MDQRQAADFATRWERHWNAHDHAGNRVCEFLTFDGPLVIAGHATYLTDSAATASGIPPAA